MNTELRILIADDHDVVRAGLRSLLGSVEGWSICAEASDGRTAVTLATETHPDIAILDIRMKQMNGIDAAVAMRKKCPKMPVLMLSLDESDQFVCDALAAGAAGYVIKADAGHELLKAVEAISAGGTFFSSGIAPAVARSGWAPQSPRAPKRTPAGLTRREREVVQLLCEGQNNKATAARLGISVKTVETHRARIMDKLQLESFAELVHFAVRNRIVSS